jgi:hypothetical protein
MFDRLRRLLSGQPADGRWSGGDFDEPPALVIARRERTVDADWHSAKSWLGELPKLGDTAWPRDGRGKPLHFLAQLDLAEIAQAGGGRTALPVEGAFSFFAGGETTGRVLHIKRPGLKPTAPPDDISEVEGIGGDPFVDRSHRFGPRKFPFWPVQFRALIPAPLVCTPDDDAMDRARQAQAEAIARHFHRRDYNFSVKQAAADNLLGEVPLYWLAALIFAERVPRMRDQVAKARARGEEYVETSLARLRALEAGQPPPAGQGRFGDPSKEKANSENWLRIGRKARADADEHAAAVDAYITKVAAAEFAPDPWKEISTEDGNRLDVLFGQARSKELENFSRYLLPYSWRDYATDAIKQMAAGPDEAYVRLPKVWRDLINSRYCLPAGGAHLMFGIGDNIQGNEMFEYPDMRMLLQLTHDDMMYWPFGDNGVYQFWMPVSALRDGDVSQVKVTFECH